MRPVAALLAAALALPAGCARYEGRRDAAELQGRLSAVAREQDACYAGLRSDPAAARVGAYLVDGPDDPGRAAKEADGRRVTADMRRDLLAVHPRVATCRRLARERFAAVDPAYDEVLALTHEAEDAVLVALLDRRLTVGEANRRSLEVDGLSDAAWDAATGSLVGRPGGTPSAGELRRALAEGTLRQLADKRRELVGLGGPAGAGGCEAAGGVVTCGPAS